MQGKIYFYNIEGKIDHDDNLNIETLGRINGLKVRCHLINNTEVVGFADSYRVLTNNYDGTIHDFINIWTYDNLDESSHKLIGDENEKNKQTPQAILINNLSYIEAILFSNPSYGGTLTNKFEIIKKGLN